MKTFILVLFMITLTKKANSQILLAKVPNNNVRLTANPPFIVEGLVSQVDIECTFNRVSIPSMASVLTMVIAYSNKTDQPVFNYMASVNEMEGHAHNVTHDVEVISGSIDNNGESKLHMRFRYPETHLFGLHICEVTGFDQIGKPVSIYSTVNVGKYNATELFDFIQNVQSNLSSLEYSINRKQSCIDSQTSYIETIHNSQPTICTNYYPPIFYNGHDYFLSIGLNYINYTEMQTKCGALGGYLVELDTHDEFNFIRDYLSHQSNLLAVWIGATDEKQEGDWINEHNQTVKPTFDWAPGFPTQKREYNCQEFFVFTNWFLIDDVCIYHGNNYSYMCEIPREIC